MYIELRSTETPSVLFPAFDHKSAYRCGVETLTSVDSFQKIASSLTPGVSLMARGLTALSRIPNPWCGRPNNRLIIDVCEGDIPQHGAVVNQLRAASRVLVYSPEAHDKVRNLGVTAITQVFGPYPPVRAAPQPEQAIAFLPEVSGPDATRIGTKFMLQRGAAAKKDPSILQTPVYSHLRIPGVVRMSVEEAAARAKVLVRPVEASDRYMAATVMQLPLAYGRSVVTNRQAALSVMAFPAGSVALLRGAEYGQLFSAAWDLMKTAVSCRITEDAIRRAEETLIKVIQ